MRAPRTNSVKSACEVLGPHLLSLFFCHLSFLSLAPACFLAEFAPYPSKLGSCSSAGELSEHQLCTALTMRMEAAASLFGEERERLKVQLLAAQERIAQLQAKGSARSPGASSKRGSKSQPLQATVMENPLAGVRQVKIGQLSWGVQPGVDVLDASGRNAHS
eukprot:6187617-Pleurochrysis_carterae.AAC.1